MVYKTDKVDNLDKLLDELLAGDQDISSSGQKFELPKKSNFCPVELLSSIFFQFM